MRSTTDAAHRGPSKSPAPAASLARLLGAPSVRPAVRCDALDFRTVRGSWVEVTARVRNASDRPSAPTSLLFEVASFGAFLPWQRAGELAVPALAPRSERMLGTTLALLDGTIDDAHPRPPALDARQVPACEGSVHVRPGLGVIQRLSRAQLRAPARPGRFLAPDPHALLGHRRAQWAGGLRVQLVGRCTERQLARGLAVAPGAANLALFLAGRRPGTYCFELRGEARAWQAELLELRTGATLPADGRTPVSSVGDLCRLLGVVVRPPGEARCARLEVVVRHTPSGDRTLIEFEFDPRSPDPCCVLDGG